MTPPSFVRVAPALALAAASLAAGCGSTRVGDGRAGGAPAREWTATRPSAGEAELANGVRVVVEENHVAPLVAIQVWVAAGAADDPAELAGAAHLHEHLVLRGGKRWGPGGGIREIEAVRGSVGAWTGLDETVYQAVVAAPFFELGLDVLADAIANPNLDPAEVERARKLALDEIAGAEADPARRATQAVFAAAFAGHGYARPVMGTAASVTALSRDALAGHFAETHAGRALTVVVVGDVGKDAIEAARRAFAPIPAGTRPKGAGRGEVPSTPPAPVTISSGGFQPAEIVIGLRTPPLAVDQAAALDLMAAVLARGDGSRMVRELVRNRQLASAVRPVSFRSRDGGLWAFAVTPAPQRTAEAAEAAVGLLLELARDPAGADEISGARAALEADLARAGDGPLARAHRLGFERVIARDANDRERYLKVVRTADPRALRATVTPFLEHRRLALAVAVPGGVPAGREEAPAALKPRLEAMLKAAPDRAALRTAPAVGAGDAIRFVTPTGVRVVALRDATAPLVSVQAAWIDPTETAAGSDEVATLIAGLLDRGTRTRSAAAVAAEMRALGGSVKGFATPGALGLRADFFPRHLDRGLAVVADALAYPAFPEEAVESEGRAIAFRRRAEAKTADRGAQAALSLFQETLWPGVRRLEGEGLSTLTKLGLLDRYRRRYPLSHLVVAVVGDVEPAQVVAGVAQAFPPEMVARARPTPAPVSGLPPAPGAATTVFRAGASPDSSAVVGYPTFAPNDPNRLAVEVLADVLGGPGDGGRLAAALRDERTAGCRAGARAAAAGAPGFLVVSLTCAPVRLEAAVAAARAELSRVAAQGVTSDEVTRSARRLSGARAASLRTGMAIADALVNDEAQGLPMLSYRRNTAALAAVTAADVARVAQAVLDPKREVVAVVHPPSAAPALARTSGAER